MDRRGFFGKAIGGAIAIRTTADKDTRCCNLNQRYVPPSSREWWIATDGLQLWTDHRGNLVYNDTRWSDDERRQRSDVNWISPMDGDGFARLMIVHSGRVAVATWGGRLFMMRYDPDNFVGTCTLTMI